MTLTKLLPFRIKIVSREENEYEVSWMCVLAKSDVNSLQCRSAKKKKSYSLVIACCAAHWSLLGLGRQVVVIMAAALGEREPVSFSGLQQPTDFLLRSKSCNGSERCFAQGGSGVTDALWLGILLRCAEGGTPTTRQSKS